MEFEAIYCFRADEKRRNLDDYQILANIIRRVEGLQIYCLSKGLLECNCFNDFLKTTPEDDGICFTIRRNDYFLFVEGDISLLDLATLRKVAKTSIERETITATAIGFPSMVLDKNGKPAIFYEDHPEIIS